MKWTQESGRRSLVATVGDNRTSIALGLGLLLVVGLAVTYVAVVDPGTTTEQYERGNWEGTTNVSHRASVVEENPLYQVGRTLQNNSRYYATISPRLDGTFRFRYSATDSGRVDATMRQWLVLRVVDAGDESVYWQQTTPLDGVSHTDVEPGSTVSASFSRNVTALRERAYDINERLGLAESTGDIEATFYTRVRLTGTINGQRVEVDRNFAVPVTIDDNTYRVRSVEGDPLQGRTYATRVVQREYGPIWTFGGPLAILLGAGGLAALGLAWRRGELELSPEERALLEFQSQRENFEEWITAGEVPGDLHDRATVTVDSLEGLVDTAIDTDERIIEDESTGTYVVLGRRVNYVYRPPGPVRSEFEGSPDGTASGVATEPEPVTENGSGDPVATTDDASGSGTATDE